VGVVDESKYTVSEVELMLEYTNLASHAAHVVSQSNSGGYMIRFESFSTYASLLETGAGTMNILLPARFSSLRTLFIVIRETDKITTKLRDQSAGDPTYSEIPGSDMIRFRV
jgi:hypothetical protein